MITDPFSVPQLVGYAAMLTIVLALQMRTRGRILMCWATAATLFSTHFALLEAWPGAIMNAIVVVRQLYSWRMESRPAMRRYFLIFLPICWTACFLVQEELSWIGFLPALAVTCTTLASYQLNPLRLRLFLLSAEPFWFTYSVMTGSYGGIMTGCLVMSSNLIGLYRHHWLKRHQQT